MRDDREIDRLAEAHPVGRDRVDHVRDHEPDQDQQALHHSAREHRDAADAQHRDERHHRFEGGARHALDRDRREVQPDHRDHRAGHDGRHQRLDPARADRLHQRAERDVHDAARDDAAERDRNVRVRAAAAVARHRDHEADEREARAEIARHAAADQHEEQQRADARHEDAQVRVEAHQQRREHGRAEHRDDVLHAHRDHLRPREALVGTDHARARAGRLDPPAREIGIGHGESAPVGRRSPAARDAPVWNLARVYGAEMGLASEPVRGVGRRNSEVPGGRPRERTGARPRGPATCPPAHDARAAARAGREVSVRSHRGWHVVHQGLMYWNSDRFCNCA